MTYRGYEAIKDLSKGTGYRIPDLLALAQQNDPFYAGSPAQRAKAEWFAELWQRFGYSGGVHLRRIHYRILSDANRAKHDGEPYQNTEACWDYLNAASRAARYLGLVSIDLFDDHRNPEAYINAGGATREQEPEWWGGGASGWALPEIPTDLAADLDFSVYPPAVGGYDYSEDDQPYLLEVWVEKSTMDDVLLPVCRRLGANLSTSVGFQSITRVRDLLQRVARTGKPARVFYVSDYDPAGVSMPVQVARQVEYWLADYAPGADVKLTPLVLTYEQVRSYRLPRVPVKDTDRRKANFEERYGEGAVELDALEGLYPGQLAGIVQRAINPYRDETLARRLRQAQEEARNIVSEEWGEVVDPHKQELQNLERQAAAIVGAYRQELTTLARRLAGELEPNREQLEALQQAINNAVDDLEIALPERPTVDVDPPDEGAWLFDSGRNYLEQIAVYKAYRDGSAAEAA